VLLSNITRVVLDFKVNPAGGRENKASPVKAERKTRIEI
jgi:hypothetical protein